MRNSVVMAYGAARSAVIPRGPESFKTFESKSTKADVQKHLKEGLAYAKQPEWGVQLRVTSYLLPVRSEQRGPENAGAVA